MNDLNLVQEEILKFLKNLGKANGDKIRDKFISLRERLLEINEMPYQKRPFLYLDIISWLEAKIDDKPVQDVIKAKFEANKRWSCVLDIPLIFRFIVDEIWI